eukprot:CAMPEP_0197185230 /NCGR_PEP_ID=MMETSP1423-20130617/11481_1 /TAXON_ID=476441 /ORGANISM="Pseudo-nitzschia heimii, Strain UNC1101" /LENGTH=836 /DNA_ID=CAMNT_0042636239 /DNA_START=193 /DNA_END=2703 /DNA_ORIENTATION=-
MGGGGIVDPKLNHLVRKCLSTIPNEGEGRNANDVVDWLRKKYREYQRKDIGKLRCQVQTILTNIEEKLEESAYDKEARAHDEQRSKVDLHVNNLNASLTNRYRKLQQERDAEERANAALRMSEASDLQESSEMDTTEINEDDDSSKKRSREDSDNNIVATTPSVEKRSSKTLNGGKSSKRKKPSGARRNGSKSGYADTGLPGKEAAATICEPIPRPSERYTDLGGVEDILTQIRQLVEYPLVRPELYRHLGVDPPRGVLLRGPPGCGKTHLVNSIAGQLGIPYFRVSSPELVSGMSGESEARIRELFQAASDSAPAIIFLDELDAIAPKRNDGKGMEKRMVAQLLTCLDMLQPKNNRNLASVLVLGATNRADSIDPALRRAGRFDKEILMGVPDEEARIGILRTMTKKMKLSGDFDLKVLARRTPGYVGADVRSLTKEAAVIAINRIFKDVLVDQKLPSDMIDADNPPPISPLTAQEMESLYITMQDFLEAVPKVQPSSKREGFATVPGVSWDDIGALGSVREELTLSVLEPIRNPEKFQALGIPLPAGVMLYGPPGCGKTLLAKAIANESGANFISVKGPELLDKYVGESERSVRLVFERARASSPCVVFFDELDSLCPKRGGDSSGGGVSERVVNQLLTEMDGLESRRSVFVIAATNRPELIDPAMMRPGRLDKLLYVSLPAPKDRVSILKAISSNIKFSPDVDLHKIGTSPKAEGYSGADCAALLREAGLAVLKESSGKDVSANGRNESEVGSETENEKPALDLCIRPNHFDYAFAHVVPSVSRKDQARYHRMRDRMARARSRGAVLTDAEPVNDGKDQEKEIVNNSSEGGTT